MMHTLARWSIPLGALLILGPLAWMMIASLQGVDGGDHASLLVGVSPVKGLVYSVVVFALAAAIGMAGSRLISRRMGLFAAGLVVAWASLGTGRVDAMIRASGGGGVLYRLAIEGALTGVLTVALAWIVLKLARPEKDAPPDHLLFEEDSMKEAPIAAGTALVVMAVVAFFVARYPAMQQCLAATTIGAALGVLAARASGGARVPAMALIAPLALLGVLGPLAAALTQSGGGGVEAAASAGKLLQISHPLPLHWAGGILLGAPMGMSWARSFTHKHEAAPAPVAR